MESRKVAEDKDEVVDICTCIYYTIKAPLSHPPTQGGGGGGVKEEEDKRLIYF
jgi:hypothetical protein